MLSREDLFNKTSAEDVLKLFREIPYENISKINAGRQLRMEEEVLDGFFKYGTGGTCFSLVWLLKSILKRFHPSCYICLADRKYGQNTHCAVICEDQGGKYLLDPGYLIYIPIKIPQNGDILEFAHCGLSFRLTSASDGESADMYSIMHDGSPKFRYTIKMERVSDSDFLDAWKNSFNFDMMNYIIFNKFKKNLKGEYELHYLKNKTLHAGGKIIKMTEEEAVKYLADSGISSEKASEAYRKIRSESM